MNLEKLIEEGRRIQTCEMFGEAVKNYEAWRQRILELLLQAGVSSGEISRIKVCMQYLETPFSQEENLNRLRITIDKTIQSLEIMDIKEPNVLNRTEALLIVRRILENFYLHIKTMYYDKPHGKGTITSAALSGITIGNEYDIQRILYSLLKPVFPESRLEVNEDSGYSGFRYDIYINEYDLAIEVKCTRPGMTEKRLTDELEADAFHYQTGALFVFIYDKEELIKDVYSFKKSHQRIKKDFGKDVEVFIVQQVNL